MTAYYNEFDPYAAQWLRNLIAAGHLPAGVVDERSIAEVSADDLAGFDQCHFFAGIGGWPLALRMAGWPDTRPVWTGSCPCQPFSLAGRRRGMSDERHLWPTWFDLISQRRPPSIFGEQVASAALWLDAVFSDLEGEGYACGAAVIPAVAVDAPHVRKRLWFVADAAFVPERKQAVEGHALADGRQTRAVARRRGEPLADPDRIPALRPSESWRQCNPWRPEPEVGRVVNGVSHKLVEAELRGFGNAIVPQAAAQFVSAYMEAA